MTLVYLFVVNFSEKFQRGHTDQGRRMREWSKN